MKSVLFCSYQDFSNLCQGFARSLQSVGVRSESLCLIDHNYAYTDQSRKVTLDEMQEAITEYDIVVIGHSQPYIFNLAKHSGKEIIPLHTGTIYRRNPAKMNLIYNRYCSRTLLDSPEFFRAGCNHPIYVAAAIDTDVIKAVPDKNTSVTFAHYPSAGGFKGTEEIKKMMASMPQVKFVCDETIVPHEQNLKRISDCSVYIEMFSPYQEGNEYGSFGVQATEAAALGRVVITNALHRDVYENAYGELPFFICNDSDTFKETILFLNNNPSLVQKYQEDHRKWVEEKHNFKATGLYLKKILA